MFHKIANNDDRREYGGSAFIEMQYCKLKIGTSIKRLVAVDSINKWQNDSLYIYIDDIDTFYCEYKEVFTNGLYNNNQFGIMDIHGINYYAQQEVLKIIDRITSKKPKEYEKLLEWLDNGLHYNGIYILGI